MIYRLTNRAYKQFLQAGKDGKEPNARDYGKYIGNVAFTTIDTGPDDYRMAEIE